MKLKDKCKFTIAMFAMVGGTVMASADTRSVATYSFVYKDTKVYGSREIVGYEITGIYKYDNFGRLTEPRVELRADGQGCWANHGRACTAIEWWLEADENGQTKTKVYEGRIYGGIFFKHLEEAGAKKVGDYSGQTLMIDPAKKQIIIAGERVKPI